jgi:hypothetical protein
MMALAGLLLGRDCRTCEAPHPRSGPDNALDLLQSTLIRAPLLQRST